MTEEGQEEEEHAVCVKGERIGLQARPLAVLEAAGHTVVLLDPDAELRPYGQFENLFAISPGGERAWLARLPTSSTGDCYLSAALSSDGDLEATSFSGYRVVIDPRTGGIVESTFTK
ncbi:MAG: hypothetical protein DHS20C19_13800 [Acidimicrobiales bacterium]|nr:MAG: hypothetical protein DHS20C19_13800 [Acidimicrobiales bacterium]